MEPSGIEFTERRAQPDKQWPFPNKKVGQATKAKRHPLTRRYMFMREDHDRRNLHDGPVNPDRLKTEDWAGVSRTVKKARPPDSLVCPEMPETRKPADSSSMFLRKT